MAACFPMRAALLGSAALLFPLTVTAQESTPLEPIVVQSKREVATDTATALTTINQTEIDDRQAGTIAELIDSVPGVTLINGSTPQGSGINIRGFGANSSNGTDGTVLIQVDGANQGAEELYRIGTQLFTDPSLYKNVEVQRGTVGSFEYGSGVVGGIVRLQTKDASDFTGGVEGFAGRQTLEFGTNGDGINSSTILAWQPTADLEFLANYTWRDMGRQQDGDGDPIEAEPFTLPSYLVKAKYTFGAARDQSLTLSLDDSKSADRDVPYDQFGAGGATFGNVDRDTHKRQVSLTYRYNPVGNDLVDLEALLARTEQRIDSTYIDGSSSMEGTAMWPIFMGSVLDLANADHDTTTTQMTLRNTARFVLGATEHELRGGVEFIKRDRESNSVSAPGGTDKRTALFLVDDIRVGTGLTVTPALRYEVQTLDSALAPIGSYATEFDNKALMGGLGLRYEFANGVAVFASGAYTEVMPILDDYTSANVAKGWMSQSQKSRTWEIGASYAGGGLFLAGDALQVKGNLYETAVWDVTAYSGVTHVETQGVELEAAYSLASGFYVDANLNIAEGDQFSALGRTAWSQSVSDRVRVTVGQKFGDELDLSWETVANARFDRVDPEVAGSVIHNIRATYAPQSGILEGTELRLGVENLFDTDYRPRLATRDAPGRNVKFTIAKAF